MNTNHPEVTETTRRLVGKFGGYRQAARELGLEAKDATTLHDIMNHKSVSDDRKQRILDALAKQDNTVRVELRMPPYFVAYSP